LVVGIEELELDVCQIPSARDGDDDENLDELPAL